MTIPQRFMAYLLSAFKPPRVVPRNVPITLAVISQRTVLRITSHDPRNTESSEQRSGCVIRRAPRRRRRSGRRDRPSLRRTGRTSPPTPICPQSFLHLLPPVSVAFERPHPPRPTPAPAARTV